MNQGKTPGGQSQAGPLKIAKASCKSVASRIIMLLEAGILRPMIGVTFCGRVRIFRF
jgi:hypothetical protein